VHRLFWTAALLAGLALSAAFAAPGIAAPGTRAAAPSQADPICSGTLVPASVPSPGRAPRLRMGIGPNGASGASGAAVAPVPDDPARTLAALARLRPRGAPLVLRLNRFFWSDGERGLRRFLALTRRYTSRGYLVELQVRYHPSPRQEGDIPAWTRWVRRVVRAFGPNRRVVGLQIANEVNLTFSPDSSDGAYRGARQALVQGVIAAKDEARRRGFRQLTVGFNWFFQLAPATEASFWESIRAGGPRFRAALDWVGLDTYPGTFFPLSLPPARTGEGILAGLNTLRGCWLRRAGIPRSVPVHVEENGWPTGPGRSEADQAVAMRSMVGAANAARRAYHVTDYRWFSLRDHRTSSPNFQHHYGLLRDDYSPKPAFAVYKRLLARLAGR